MTTDRSDDRGLPPANLLMRSAERRLYQAVSDRARLTSEEVLPWARAWASAQRLGLVDPLWRPQDTSEPPRS